VAADVISSIAHDTIIFHHLLPKNVTNTKDFSLTVVTIGKVLVYFSAAFNQHELYSLGLKPFKIVINLVSVFFFHPLK
jgi:hypothetical protein